MRRQVCHLFADIADIADNAGKCRGDDDGSRDDRGFAGSDLAAGHSAQ
jgi:hypothetical protein